MLRSDVAGHHAAYHCRTRRASSRRARVPINRQLFFKTVCSLKTIRFCEKIFVCLYCFSLLCDTCIIYILYIYIFFFSISDILNDNYNYNLIIFWKKKYFYYLFSFCFLSILILNFSFSSNILRCLYENFLSLEWSMLEKQSYSAKSRHRYYFVANWTLIVLISWTNDL